jgi:hypothetical protein
MVSSRKSILIPCAALVAIAAQAGNTPSNKAIGPATPAPAAGKKFLADDPLWKEPKPVAVHNVKTVDIDNLYDFIDESFAVPRRGKRLSRQGEAAANVNTLGEVPDSEWYTNRHATRPMTIAELVRGPGNENPPDPDGKWHVISAKTDGVTPGFRVEDAHGNQYLLKFDPPDYPELASAPDVIGSKFYYALGYNTPENYIANFRRDQLTISETSTWRDKLGKKHALTAEQVDRLLADQKKDGDGRYRAMASRWVAGKAVGPFTFSGTRSDDPNDLVPHELRRELRGMAVFASWLNDTDAKAINTLDSLVEENGVEYIRHFRIDWGASLGSDSLQPKDVRRGHDYFLDPKATLDQAVSFGFYLPAWMRDSIPSIRGVGTFDYRSFNAAHWKSNYPAEPFLLMDDQDAFWAAKKVMAFSDDDIRAMVETGKYTDPRATDWVTLCLIKRRDMIGQAWLSRGLALDNFRVEGGRLTFEDLAEKYKAGLARSYSVKWSAFDNSTGNSTPVPSSDDRVVPSADGRKTGFLAASIQVAADTAKSEAPQVTVYLRSVRDGWEVVGIDRKYK